MTKSKQGDKKRTASPARGKRRSTALVLTQMQMGLALGFVTIGIIVAFGSGFIVAMWYQASQYSTLHEDGALSAAEAPVLSRPMTFYSTLTDGGEASPSSTASPPTRSASPQPARTSAANPAPRSPAAAAQGTKGRTPAVTRQPPRRQAPRTTAAAAVAPSSGVRYSVQVGSFRTQEQAERLRRRLVRKGYAARMQPSVIPGKGTWYRIRVGHFSDRGAAAQKARRLAKQERVSVMVTTEPR